MGPFNIVGGYSLSRGDSLLWFPIPENNDHLSHSGNNDHKNLGLFVRKLHRNEYVEMVSYSGAFPLRLSLLATQTFLQGSNIWFYDL